MKHTLTISGGLPDMDEYIYAQNTHRSMAERMRRDALDKCMWQIRRQIPDLKITMPIKIHFNWIEASYRRDLVSISGMGHSIIQEALMQCSVIKDISLIVGYTDSISVDAFNPQIIITLEEVNG